jgi:hypothetical protein
VLENMHRPENEKHLRNFTYHEMHQRSLIHEIYTGEKHTKMKVPAYLKVTLSNADISEEQASVRRGDLLKLDFDFNPTH